MATATLGIPNETYAAAFQKYYDAIPQQKITPQEIALDEQTQESIASSINSYMRPYYDMAVANRQQTAVQNRAELDADAYSRGMGASTWLTDKKARETSAAASDVANIQAQYGASVAEGANTLWQNYQANKLAVSQANAANRLSAEQYNSKVADEAYQLAYAMLMDSISRGDFAVASSGGSTSDGSPDPGKDGDFITNAEFSARLKTALSDASDGTQRSSSKQTGTSKNIFSKSLASIS